MKKLSLSLIAIAIILTSLSAMASNNCGSELGRVKASITNQNKLAANYFENTLNSSKKTRAAGEALIQMLASEYNPGRDWIYTKISLQAGEIAFSTENMFLEQERSNESIQRAIQKLSDCLTKN